MELSEGSVTEHRNVLELYCIFDLLYKDEHLIYIDCLNVGINVKHGIYNVKTPHECFQNRVLQNNIRGSAINYGINA
jgi:hypothetical protein